jgi:uncharacterized protein with FMN-binding domain
MKSFIRMITFSASVAAALAAAGTAQASNWFSLHLFGDPAPSNTSVITPDAQPVMPATPTVQLAASKLHFKDGMFQGGTYDAYWGKVQVQATVQGGRLVTVDVLNYPNHRSTSRAINRQALPMLQSEVIAAQGVRVNIISGATLTSNAYLRSLYTALKQSAN